MTKVKNHHSQKADDGKSLRLAGQWGVIGVEFGVAPTHLQLYFLSQRKHHGIMSWHNGMWQCLHETDWVQFSHSVESNSLRPHGLQHAMLPCPSPIPELAQTHVHQVGDAIQLLSPSPPAFNLSQHQGLFKWVSSSHQVAKVLEFHCQHQSFQWIFRTDFL